MTSAVKDAYTELEERLLSELDEIENDPGINSLINYKLPNSSEETDFKRWGECFEDCLTRHLPVIEEWERM